MRRHFTFLCEGARLVATLDEPPHGIPGAPSALLLVTGGNEVRSGAWSGQAQFADRVAAAGYPVLRFDRRGCGDSDGVNTGFRGSAADLAAALVALRVECPTVTRVVGMGNCDAASALMLAGGAGCAALLLSNPWTFDNDGNGDDAVQAPPQAVRSHYRNRLADWRAIKRLLTGQVALGPLFRSLVSAARPAPPPTTLAQDMAAGIVAFAGPVRLLVADRDRTGQAFLATCDAGDRRLRRCPNATHSFVEPHARDWLVEQALDMLRAG